MQTILDEILSDCQSDDFCEDSARFEASDLLRKLTSDDETWININWRSKPEVWQIRLVQAAGSGDGPFPAQLIRAMLESPFDEVVSAALDSLMSIGFRDEKLSSLACQRLRDMARVSGRSVGSDEFICMLLKSQRGS